MDAYEATRIVFSRIQTMDPENAAKIMGLLLKQDHGEKEMIRLAFGPETLVHSVVVKSRKELGLLTASTPSTPSSSSSSSSSYPFSRHSSTTTSRLSSSALPSPSSWAPPPVFSRSNSANTGAYLNSAMDDVLHSSEELMPTSGGPSPFYSGVERIDQFQLQDQLSFLNDPSANSIAANSSSNSLFYPDVAAECRSPNSNGGDGMMFPYLNWEAGGGVNGHHRRSCSMADIYSSSDATGFGWKPCLYFARGYCKNGSSCRFQHSLPDDATVAAAMPVSKMDAMVEQQCHELLLRSKSQRLGNVASSQLLASAASYPYGTSSPSSTSGKCMNFLLQQQQQNETQRAASAAAAAMMLSGDESHKLFGRSRMDRYDYTGLANPGSRQIYLTFPADSTFREEDVSNYFSIYGPVQDVRIPYQQKRMFGFVTFVYPDTVKHILAKGNPHYVCDARVLVKPYKEKGKLPDKKLQQQQQQSERGDFSGCSTPTGVDSRDPYDPQQLGARMLYNNNQEMLLRRKLEEQQQAAELQQALELQGRRFMDLQLLDMMNGNISSPTPVNTATTIKPTSCEEDNCSSAPVNNEEQKKNKSTTGNAAAEAAGREGNRLSDDGNFQESAEHNLPDSPFASPTRFPCTGTPFPMGSGATNSTSNSLLGTSNLDMASIRSCFFPMPRLNSSGHGAVGL